MLTHLTALTTAITIAFMAKPTLLQNAFRSHHQRYSFGIGIVLIGLSAISGTDFSRVRKVSTRYHSRNRTAQFYKRSNPTTRTGDVSRVTLPRSSTAYRLAQ